MIQHYLLEIKKAIQDELVLGGGLKLYFDASYHPEWHVCTCAKVVSKPRHITNVAEGDEVFISYSVIAERTWTDASDSFFPITENNRHYQQWQNRNGQWLTKRALPTPTRSILWVAYWQDNYLNILEEGVQGTESDVDRWLSQFSFKDSGTYRHKHLTRIGKNNLWKAQIFDIFAKRASDGSVQSVSDRVILQPLVEDKTDWYVLQGGVLQNTGDKIGAMYTDRGIVVSGGEAIGLQKGDIAGFEPRFCEKYTFDNTEYFLVKENRIDVIWQPNQN